MNIEVINIQDIKPAERNVRFHGDKQIEAFIKSVEMFGQIRPIVTDEDLVIIAGHGLHEAMIKMGRKDAKVLRMIGLSETDKKKLMLADNKLFELGNSDNQSVMQILEEIKAEGASLDVPGYDMEVLENILGEMEDVDEVLASYGAPSEERVEQIAEAEIKHQETKYDGPKEMVLNPDVVQVEQKSRKDVPKPFVVCTGCGEKIWL